MNNKEYVLELIKKVVESATRSDSAIEVLDELYDDLIKYKRMWDTLKGESGYRTTINGFSKNYTPTVAELMKNIEGRVDRNKNELEIKINDKTVFTVDVGMRTGVEAMLYASKMYDVYKKGLPAGKHNTIITKKNRQENTYVDEVGNFVYLVHTPYTCQLEKKVFCSDCEYFCEGGRLGMDGPTISPKCDAPENKKPYDTFRKIMYTYRKFPNSINKKNNCTWYKEKK